MGWSRDQTQTPPRAGLFNLWEGRRPYKVRYAPEPPPYRHSWQTEALASEVRGILDAIDAPPADSEVVLQFQKTLYRRKYCDYDARGQIILTCRCILESKGNEGAFSEPFVE